jgi:hypothetical protein
VVAIQSVRARSDDVLPAAQSVRAVFSAQAVSSEGRHSDSVEQWE